MPTTKTNLTPKNQAAASGSAPVTFADILAARRAARAAWLAARQLPAGLRLPIALFCPHETEPQLANDLRTALGTLPLQILETLTPAAADFTAADFVILPSLQLGSHHTKIVRQALAAGCVPILAEQVAPKNLVIDYEPIAETGNSFLATHASVWGLFAAITRAVETFRFPYDWKAIIRSAVQK